MAPKPFPLFLLRLEAPETSGLFQALVPKKMDQYFAINFTIPGLDRRPAEFPALPPATGSEPFPCACAKPVYAGGATGSHPAERSAPADDPMNLIRVMPAEGVVQASSAIVSRFGTNL